MAVSDATYDNTEQLLIGVSLDKTAKVWSLKNNKLLNTFTGHIGIQILLFRLYQLLFLILLLPKVPFRRVRQNNKRMGFREFKIIQKRNYLINQYSCVSTCTSLGITFDDSNFFSGHLDGSLKIWSVGSDKPDNVIDAHDDRINYIELVKNENQILTSSK
jgi:WD40 repeat protein